QNSISKTAFSSSTSLSSISFSQSIIIYLCSIPSVIMPRLLSFISCGSNRNNKSLRLGKDTSFQSNDKKLFSKLNSNISSKALSMVKMISWRKVQAESDEDDDHDHDDNEADSDKPVWRKTIMMDSANHDQRNHYHFH
ncbi:hypothetical protein CIPAW_03G068500, partial [Carya illinoinensis]